MISSLKKGGIFFFVLILFVVGCSRPRPRIEDLPLPDPALLLEKIERNRTALKDFEGLGLILLRGPDGKSAMGVNVTHLVPDFLKLSFQGSLGVSLGTLVLARDRYSLFMFSPYSIQESGLVGDASLLADFGIPVGGGDLLGLFLPFMSISEIPDTATIQLDRSQQQYFLTWSDSSGIYRLWADPFQPVILKELLLSSSGDTIWYKELDQIKKRSGVFIPSSWKVQLGCGEASYSMKLKLSSIWLNRGLSPADFKVNKSHKFDSVEGSNGG